MTVEALARTVRPSSGAGAFAPRGATASLLPAATPRGQHASADGKPATFSLDPARPPSRSRPHHRKQGPPSNFALTVARTVDVLRGDGDADACTDMRRILADIRKQFDDVHCEADRREEELVKVRREIRLLEAESERSPPELFEFASVGHEDLQRRLSEVAGEYDAASETKRVYQHMVSRLRRELQIVQQKVTIMQGHLRRKTGEVEKGQDASRRVHQRKVARIEKLEDMEQEIEEERGMCSAALEDLEEAARQKRSEVNHREEFERWRYEVALEAANQAFQATAGRYRKIYAIEKLCGNCLQKHTFEQAEQSQATEDGFQKIREVTGLTDVMDIVTKFLNRDQEHDQLRLAVREAEVRLHSLREAESARHGDGACFDNLDDLPKGRGLIAEVASQEQQVLKADHDLEQLQSKIKKDTLLLESILTWGDKMRRSLTFVEELPRVECPPDIVPYFQALVDVSERFLTKAHDDKTPQQLAKLATQACTKEYTEQMKLLGDKEFLRLNLRVPATLDQRNPSEDKKKGGGQNEDERQEQEHELERDRVKDEAFRKTYERAPHKMPRPDRAREAQRRDRSDALGHSAHNATDVVEGQLGEAKPDSSRKTVTGGVGGIERSMQSASLPAGQEAPPRPRSQNSGLRVTAEKGQHLASRIKQGTGPPRPHSSAR